MPPKRKTEKAPRPKKDDDGVFNGGESDEGQPAKKPKREASDADDDGREKALVGLDTPLVDMVGGVDLVEELVHTPLGKLVAALEAEDKLGKPEKKKDGVVVYWVRNKDLRLEDNRALALAAQRAEQLKQPLVVFTVISPGDYTAHDRSRRRVDFILRTLADLRTRLHAMNIPLFTPLVTERETIPARVCGWMREWNASYLYANVEYEVDELGRDREVVERVVEARKGKGKGKGGGWDGVFAVVKDVVVVAPGEILSGAGRPYSVFSPWYKAWSTRVTSNLDHYVSDQGGVLPNHSSARSHKGIGPLFAAQVPESVAGFELEPEEKAKMAAMWPVGEEVPEQILERFMATKMRQQVFQHAVLHDGAEAADSIRQSRAGEYVEGRVRMDLDGTSRLSPYLAAGLLSCRAALRATMQHGKTSRLNTDHRGGGGPPMWVSEVAWRDFYQHVLAAFPRVCRGLPYSLKYRDIVWEQNEEHLQRWKDGRTGVPIVDAAMRSLKEQGWMHNRGRMIVAMYLTKNMMINWQHGERWFMHQLIDGDFGSNNGGWQWSASTGTDPQPYFRIFNPTSQANKADPDGDFIRHWVPEIAHLKGKALYEPFTVMPSAELVKLGYCAPVVDYTASRKRALARYKNPGDDADE